jgi:hypothetical protein
MYCLILLMEVCILFRYLAINFLTKFLLVTMIMGDEVVPTLTGGLRLYEGGLGNPK